MKEKPKKQKIEKRSKIKPPTPATHPTFVPSAPNIFTSKIPLPKKEIPLEKLTELLIHGCTLEECAGFLDTTAAHIVEEVRKQTGSPFHTYKKSNYEKGNAILKTLQFMAAEKGSIPMLFWLGKQRLGQRDTPLQEQEVPKDMKTFMEVLRNKYDSVDFKDSSETGEETILIESQKEKDDEAF